MCPSTKFTLYFGRENPTEIATSSEGSIQRRFSRLRLSFDAALLNQDFFRNRTTQSSRREDGFRSSRSTIAILLTNNNDVTVSFSSAEACARHRRTAFFRGCRMHFGLAQYFSCLETFFSSDKLNAIDNAILNVIDAFLLK